MVIIKKKKSFFEKVDVIFQFYDQKYVEKVYLR